MGDRQDAQVTAESLKPMLLAQVDEFAQQMADAINNAPDGAVIDGSEEVARRAIHEFGLAAYEGAVQKRVDAAEAAFSPSGEPTQRETVSE